MKEEILSFLSPGYPWADRFHYFPTIGSTNDTLRALARQGALHGTVIAAGHQTNGHGRRSRSFQSPKGLGIYLSILFRPDCAPTDLMHLTCAAAVAMCEAVENAAGFRPGIKWTNDLVYQKKKLGGILTELGFTSQGTLDYAIVGIGINCLQDAGDFSPELRSLAGSVSMFAPFPASPARMAAAMMESLWHMDDGLLTGKDAILHAYRRDCITVEQDISLVRGEEVRHGHAIGVDNNGALVVRFPDGTVEAVNSGEVSVRGMYGYL